MKKTLVASILGLAVSAVSSYGQGTVGQGYIAFNTYDSSGYAPAVWTSTASKTPGGDSASTYVSQSGFTADLLYSDSASSGDTYVNGNTATPMVSAGVTLVTVGGIPGYILGTPGGANPGFAFLDYTSGSVTFTIEVFQGASYAAAVAGTDLGYGSLTWTETSSVVTAGPANFFESFPATFSAGGGPTTSPLIVQENAVPEPATLALLGLGAAGLLALRRRKA